jgi:hypothetical protein
MSTTEQQEQVATEQQVQVATEQQEQEQNMESAEAKTSTSFKAYPMMKSYADYLVEYVKKLTPKLSEHTLKKQKSTVMTQFSLPGRSETISDIYYAGRNPDNTMIEPTRENGGFPIVLLVQGPRGKFTKMTAISIANDILKSETSIFFLTTSRGRIYLNWA